MVRRIFFSTSYTLNELVDKCNLLQLCKTVGFFFFLTLTWYMSLLLAVKNDLSNWDIWDHYLSEIPHSSLQMRKLRPREKTGPAQGHTVADLKSELSCSVPSPGF